MDDRDCMKSNCSALETIEQNAFERRIEIVLESFIESKTGRSAALLNYWNK